jgi:PBP1b-binding outer membrane lipoprotein LpoB
MKKLIAITSIILFLAGCATSPEDYQFYEDTAADWHAKVAMSR